MIEIIKYQLKERKGSMILILAIFGIMNALAFILEIWTFASGRSFVHPENMFWVIAACMATVIVTIVMFFMCASGHVGHLLYKDTSYLMLTVPRHGWEILGGRFVAGIIEFATYFIAVCFLASVHLAVLGPIASPAGMNPFALFAFMYEQIFFANFASVAQGAFIGLCLFTVIGMILTFAVVASRSIVKNRGIATAIAIAVFFLITNWAGRLGAWISAKWDWYWTIKLCDKPIKSLFLQQDHARITFEGLQSVPVPVAPIILALALAAALFAAASWLMEKRVEL
jgi:hypothetical protein